MRNPLNNVLIIGVMSDGWRQMHSPYTAHLDARGALAVAQR